MGKKETVKYSDDVRFKILNEFYSRDENINQLLEIISGESNISLRLLDWFVTNYSKKINIVYPIKQNKQDILFNVYLDYKAQLKAFNKRRFDPFCRKNRTSYYYGNTLLQIRAGNSDWRDIGVYPSLNMVDPDNFSPSFRRMKNGIHISVDGKEWAETNIKCDNDTLPEYRLKRDKGQIVETTIGQLNFFYWAIKNKIVDYVNEHYDEIYADMNQNNNKNTKKYKSSPKNQKRHELSKSANKSINKHYANITLRFEI